jgi:DNA-binding NarL/FixJ family response regulator
MWHTSDCSTCCQFAELDELETRVRAAQASQRKFGSDHDEACSARDRGTESKMNNQMRPWSREDDLTIAEMQKEGKSVEEIAAALGRTPVAVQRRIADSARVAKELRPKMN